MRTTSSIKLGTEYLIPAPYVSSSYEYIKSGQYIIGGVLNVTLDGTIVGEDIASQIQNISTWSSNTNCINLTIGCDGSADFLEGQGRITNISINTSDSSPFTATYSIVVALEVVNGEPAVSPDSDFLALFGLSSSSTLFIKEYEEQVSIDGDATIVGYVDNILNISKSFIKATGSISVTSSTVPICGVPGFNGIQQSINLIKDRFNKLISFSFSQDGHPLSQYAGWSKWLDSKSFSIDKAGKVSCSFDIYLNKGSCQPIARIDLKTEDKLDHTTNSNILNRSISGTINGLSTATTNLLSNKTGSNERLGNAYAAFNALSTLIINGNWPGDYIKLTGEEGDCTPPTCPPSQPTVYYQRLSSNINISKVAGEITFSAEFGPTNGCQLNNFDISTTIEEELPAVRYREFIIPNSPKPVIQYLGDTPAKVTISSQGSIKDCDINKKTQLICSVKKAFNQALLPYLGWILTSSQITESKFSYKITSTYIRCDF